MGLRYTAPALAAALVLTLTGCTAFGGELDDSAESPSPQPSATASPHSFNTPPASTALEEPGKASWLESETLLGELSSTRGVAEIGPVVSEAGRVVVYVKCFGIGAITVEVVGSAEFTQPCSQDEKDPGTRNQIQARDPNAVVVRGTSENSNLWAIALTDGEPS